MRLVRVKTQEGDDMWVNPDNVCTISTAGVSKEFAKIRTIDTREYTVPHSPEELAKKMDALS